MEPTLSDVIIRYLEQFGVEYVFSVPGSPLGPLYEALARSEKRGGARSVLARHEAGAAFMADGYARETGKIGVCCATTGPGATNLLTGIACADADHVPMLAITPQTPLPTFGLAPFQESSGDATDIVGMFDHCTRYNTLVAHPDQLEQKLAAALTVAMQAPKGPAHLSIPLDILRAPAKGGERLAYPDLHRLACEPALVADNAALEKLCSELCETLSLGRHVVVLAGHDCAGAADEIRKFAEIAAAPMITTQRGKRWVDPYHPLARGVFGFAGHASARAALTDPSVGLILAAGTDLGEWATAGWDPALLNDRLVHIHDTKACFARSPMAHMHVYGTVRTIFSRLADRMEAFAREARPTTRTESDGETSGTPPGVHEASAYVPGQIRVQAPESCLPEDGPRPLRPQRVLRELIQRFPPETRFLIDNSNSVPWSIHYFFSRSPENCHLSTGFASMGWAVGAAVGMAMGAAPAPVICLTGDGCYLMSAQEITVAVERRLPVIFVVLVDRAYGMIQHSLRRAGGEPVALPVPPVDFCGMAKAAGADAHVLRRPEDFEKLDYPALCAGTGPTLLEIHIDAEEAPPLGMA